MGIVTLHYTKRRAHGLVQKTMRMRDGGLTTPGGLIRAIVGMTGTTRRFHPSEALFVFYHACGFHAELRHPKLTLAHWISRHGIVDDSGHPLTLLLSRLRKTHKALWYLKSGGHMTRFAVGHTVEIAARHYAHMSYLRPLQEMTIAEALEDASRPPSGTTSTAEQGDGQNDTDTPPDIQPLSNDDIPQAGTQDVWLASCSGFYGSPFAKPGAPFSHPF